MENSYTPDGVCDLGEGYSEPASDGAIGCLSGRGCCVPHGYSVLLRIAIGEDTGWNI